MKLLAIVALAVIAAGCATKQEPQIVTQQVYVAVPVPCKVNLGADPVYPDTDVELAKVPWPGAPAALMANPASPTALKQMGENLLYLMAHLRAGRDMRAARDHQKQVALDKCGEPIPPPATPQP